MVHYEVHEIAKLPSGGIHIKSHGVFSLLDDADIPEPQLFCTTRVANFCGKAD